MHFLPISDWKPALSFGGYHDDTEWTSGGLLQEEELKGRPGFIRLNVIFPIIIRILFEWLSF